MPPPPPPPRDIKGQVAVVTGAAQGLGYHIAEEFLKHDLKALIILDINETKGQESTKQLNSKYGNKVIFIQCDVTKDLLDVFKKITDTYETVDILVNNAGICNEISARETLEVNTIAVIEWTMKFLEHMRKDNNGNGGTVINISSVYGFEVDPHLPFYKASKYAVMGFTKTIGHVDNFNKTGVRVMAICPGKTETDLSDKARSLPGIKDGLVNHSKRMKSQPAAAVGRAAVEVYERCESGTAWRIEGGEPIDQV